MYSKPNLHPHGEVNIMMRRDKKMDIQELFAPEDDILRWIQTEARRNGLPSISLNAEEGRLLQVLMKSVNAQKALEFGALGGYSGTWIARALPANGRLFTLEISSKHAQVARTAYERAGVAERVTLVEGDANHTLRQMEREAPFDFVFMDADPESYPVYFQAIAPMLRVGGMLTAHNALEGTSGGGFNAGRSRGMAAFLTELAKDNAFTTVVMPYGSGTLITVKNI